MQAIHRLVTGISANKPADLAGDGLSVKIVYLNLACAIRIDVKIAQNPRRTYDLGDESLQAGPASSPLEFLIKQSFVILISAGEFE